ncbi:hypothetical protein [Cognaticolwellia mytili]|uniref:hypothetical protein n=1 Tax=Cognaticolwellia mytili TaxID=1888913 RepID=UPI000A1729D4|nr:hypothetical protein [Cognaticolwellia mytili]
MSSLFIRLLIASAFLLSFGANTTDWVDNISTSGFIAAGALNISSNEDDKATKSSSIVEGGLHLSAILPKNIEMNGQVLYRDVGDLSNYSNFKAFSLDYLTFDWRYSGSENSEQVVSIGRFKSNGGIYSNTRDIPFTRPSILLAQPIYTEESRSINSHIDGIRFNSTIFTSQGDYSVEVGFGDNELSDNFISSLLQGDNSDSISADGMYFLDLRYRNSNWLIVSTYHNVEIEFAGAIAGDSFGVPNFNFDINMKVQLENLLLGVQYLTKDFEITAELIKQKATTPMIDIFSSYSSKDLAYKAFGYYLQARYFITPTVSMMARYENLDLDLKDMPEIVNSLTGNALSDSENYGLSLIWLIDENWQIAADYHIRKNMHVDTKYSLIEVSWRF